MHSEISQGLRNFLYGYKIFAILAKFSQCHSENPVFFCIPLAFSSASISSIPLHISSYRLDEIAENSYEHGINRHKFEAKPEMMAEVPKTCKTTKNNLKTISVVLNEPAHVNWLNSYD